MKSLIGPNMLASVIKRALFATLYLATTLYCNVGLCNETLLIKKIEDYLNTIETMKADFVQIGANKEKKIGVLHLQKPGQLKLEYLSPTHITVIADQENLLYYDHEMEELTKIKNNDHILTRILTQRKIDLKTLCVISSLVLQDNILEIMLHQKDSDPNLTYPTLIAKFTTKPSLKLTSLYVINDEYDFSEIILSHVTENPQIAADTFLFKNPKFFRLQEH